jgi:16S rRNA C967 or C1407 C5-methylase (RsmB/RsmF family)/NOL1/NOP2/fmu family ribosome biogenesis protein
MNEFPLPAQFVARLRNQLSDADLFVDAVDKEAGTSIRMNPYKQIRARELPLGQLVQWNNQGLYLSERPKYSHDPNYHAGRYYPMEASSMFLGHVLKHIDLPEDALLLDLCAAPGGKSLILKDAFPDHLLISNEIDGKRVHVLKENAIRWGTENHIIINSDAQKLQRSGVKYDLILVDAPCSGEGLFRKDKKSRAEWTEERAAGCAVRQEGILDDVLPLLAEGGWLIYSTCTFNPDENIRRIDQLVNQHDLETISITMETDWNIEEIKENGNVGYQFWPHRVNGEGFFISLLKKSGEFNAMDLGRGKRKSDDFEYLPGVSLNDFIIQKLDQRFVAFTEEELELLSLLGRCGNIIKKGVVLGEIKGRDFLPAHDLSTNVRARHFDNQFELTQDQALDYFKGNALHVSCATGPVLLTFNGLGIGFGKSIGNRINNLLPKHLRVF